MDNSIITFSDENNIRDDSVLELPSHGVFRLIIIQRNGKRFIFKCLLPPYVGIPQYEALLKKEYDIGMKLDHPNIVCMLNLETDKEFGLGILMQWIDGMSLYDYVASNPEIKDKIRVITQIAEALSYIHSRNVCHRDLKPDNILVTRSSHDVRIIDFGLGDADDQLTLKLSAATEEYGAPEQLAGIASDNRSDVYSFGKIMDSLSLPLRFRSIINACLQTDPDKRPEMADVARRIRNRSKNTSLLLIAAFVIAIVAVVSVIIYLKPSNSINIDVDSHKGNTEISTEQPDINPIDESHEISPERPSVNSIYEKHEAIPEKHGLDSVEDIIAKAYQRVDSLTAAYAPSISKSTWNDSTGKLVEQRGKEMYRLADDLENTLRKNNIGKVEINKRLSEFWFYSANTTNKSDGLQ